MPKYSCLGFFFKIMWEPLETVEGPYLPCLHVKEPNKNKSSALFHRIAPRTEAPKIKKVGFGPVRNMPKYPYSGFFKNNVGAA